MSNTLKARLHRAFKVVIAFTPWVVSMFTLYWLEYGEFWTVDTPHRGKISVAILVVGMGLSFLLQSHFSKRKKT
jgi:hypothetical protein